MGPTFWLGLGQKLVKHRRSIQLAIQAGLAIRSGIAVKHCIKRVDRFIGNSRIEPSEAMRGLVGWLARPREKPLVSLDWVDNCLKPAPYLDRTREGCSRRFSLTRIV